ncbi:MAG: cation transporter [Chloroflexi bacterium]|nr:cation transporter [Chloroflexota bacterium]
MDAPGFIVAGDMQVDSAMDSAEGIRALKISLAGLLATATFQGVIAVAGGSAGLLADTIHNFADAFTAVPLWIAFALARRAANKRFTYGYGRAEDLAGLVVLLFVVLSAATAGIESYRKLTLADSPKLIGASIVAAVVGMVGNEAVARYKIRVGEKIGSAVLVAEGRHSRIDSLTSLAAGIGLVGVWLGFPLADPIAGLVITLAIAGILWEVGRDILGRLLDAIEPETVDEIARLASGVSGVQEVRGIRVRWLGHNITVELQICVDGRLPVTDAHTIAERVRGELLGHMPKINDVIVHVDPVETYAGEHHLKGDEHR